MNTTVKEFDRIRGEVDGKFVIGIIGATCPGYDYSPDMGFVVGNQIRTFIDSPEVKAKFGDKVRIFTGGVEGIGVDAFMGVVSAEPDDTKFFALIPKFDMVPDDDMGVHIMNKSKKPVLRRERYSLPTAYKNIARIKNTQCREVVAGEDMSDRRAFVAGIADVLVMVNGGAGTLNEAMNALRMGVPVIVVGRTGGKTGILGLRASGVRQIGAMEPPFFYHKYEAQEMNRFLQSRDIDDSLIIFADNEWDVQNKLKSIINTSNVS